MDVIKKIEIQDWMGAAGTLAVMNALNNDPVKPMALFVGGCVRNTLLGKRVDDVDIATIHEPAATTELLQAAGIKVIPTGIEHGTVTAVTEERTFEITTLRRDVETFGRHATIAFSDSWEEDAQRRDFTMNTLLLDLDGNIYDPLRNGMKDLEARRVVFVGTPAERIAEDYLRILRFFRFHAIYAQGTPDEEALAACAAAAPHIKDLSKERITQEFSKIIMADNGAGILALMFENSIMDDIATSPYHPHVLGRLVTLQREYDMASFPARLALLNPDIESLENYLTLSNHDKKMHGDIVSLLDNIHDARIEAVKRLIYLNGREQTIQALLCYAVLNDTDIELGWAIDWQVPDLPVSGEDALTAGMDAGPEVGKLLRAVETWWLEKNMQPDRAACLEKLQNLITR